MKTTKLVHGLVCAAALGAGLLGFAACGGGSSDASTIKSRDQQATKAIQHSDWKTLASLVAPSEGCSADDIRDFYENAIDEAEVDPAKIGVKDITVELHDDGTSAETHYTTVYDGEEGGRSSDDWVKVDGKWYFEAGGMFDC